VTSVRERSRLTDFGIQLDHYISKIEEHMTITDYAELTGLSYKYISQLRTRPDRRPGSYATVQLLKPFADLKVLTLNEALQFSKISRGKTLTLHECKEIFPAASETELRQAVKEGLQSVNQTVYKPQELMTIENEYCVPAPITEYIKHERPQVVKILDFSSQQGRNYINAIKTLDPDIKQVQLLIHNPLVQPVSDLLKKRTCENIKLLKVYDFNSDVLKIKCYSQTGSLRGVKFDDELIMLGWVTYYFDPNYPEYGKNQIWGPGNPLIISPLRNQGKCLGELFDRVFNSLWDDTDNVPILDVCTQQCKFNKAVGKSVGDNEECPVSKDWLKKVSAP
jgi:hypothetical protein